MGPTPTRYVDATYYKLACSNHYVVIPRCMRSDPSSLIFWTNTGQNQQLKYRDRSPTYTPRARSIPILMFLPTFLVSFPTATTPRQKSLTILRAPTTSRNIKNTLESSRIPPIHFFVLSRSGAKTQISLPIHCKWSRGCPMLNLGV